MIEARNGDPRAMLLAVGSAIAAAFALAVALLFLRYGEVIDLAPEQTAMLVTSLALVGALSVPAVYFGFRSRRGTGAAPPIPRPVGIGQFALLLIVWLASLWGMQFAAGSHLPLWSASAAHLLGIAVPVYLLIRWVTGGLGAVSAARGWGVLTAGMWIGTGLAALAEGALAILALLAIGAYLVLHPSELSSLQDLAQNLAGSNGLPHALDALRPWLARPEILLLGLVAFAATIPVVEEGAKSIATWMIFDRLRAPADGFVAGALAGAGFGLFEGLLASASSDAFSAATLVARAGSSLMHIAAGAWAGKGVADFRRTRSVGSLWRGYAAALATHGLWNASIVLIAFGGLRLGAAPFVPDYLAFALILLGGLLLAGLCSATSVALIIAHRRLRVQRSAEPHSPAMDGDLSPGAVAQVRGIER